MPSVNPMAILSYSSVYLTHNISVFVSLIEKYMEKNLNYYLINTEFIKVAYSIVFTDITPSNRKLSNI